MRGKLWADYGESGNLQLHLLLPAARKPDDARIEPPTPAIEVVTKAS